MGSKFPNDHLGVKALCFKKYDQLPILASLSESSHIIWDASSSAYYFTRVNDCAERWASLYQELTYSILSVIARNLPKSIFVMCGK